MSSALLILLARAVHILGGVAWAGSVFMMTSTILPLATRHGNEGFGQWLQPIGRKVGPAAGIAAVLTIVSGIYMMAVLHPHDRSVGGIVLISGAVAALLASSATPLPCPADWPADDERQCTGGPAHTSFFGAGMVNAEEAVQ